MAALSAIQAEWTSARDYTTRVANLHGTGSGLHLNGAYFLQADATVADDGARDVLTGSAGRDWFFANTEGSGQRDKITEIGCEEFAAL